MRNSIRLAILMAGPISISGFGCGDSDTMSGADTFRATDTVTTSIFTQTSDDTVEGTFRLRIISTGVSSGFVKLNDEEILGPSDFHNKSFDQTTVISLFDENTIEYEIRGQPGDQICVRVYEITEDEDNPERGIYEGCVDRSAGPPNNVDVVFTPTPTPTPTP